jgi:hypothetical protein
MILIMPKNLNGKVHMDMIIFKGNIRKDNKLNLIKSINKKTVRLTEKVIISKATNSIRLIKKDHLIITISLIIKRNLVGVVSLMVKNNLIIKKNEKLDFYIS